MDYNHVVEIFNKSHNIFPLKSEHFNSIIRKTIANNFDNVDFYQNSDTNLIFAYNKKNNTFALCVQFPSLWNILSKENSLLFIEGIIAQQEIFEKNKTKTNLFKKSL